ncbi:MAG: hypothetical protein QM791_20125 [Ferruginibacter sp.]
MRLLISFSFTFLFFSCTWQQQTVHFFKLPSFVLADTIVQANRFLTHTEQYSDYPIYYKGIKHDTVNIGEAYSNDGIKEKPDFSRLKLFSEKLLKIQVDTTIHTSSSREYFSDNYEQLDSTVYFSSRLLMIENICDTTLLLGRTAALYNLRREIQIKDGTWISIDSNTSEEEFCMTGKSWIILHPGEIIIAKAKKYTGDYLGKFRFTLEYKGTVAYSNTFYDHIDRRIIEDRLSKN